MSSVNARLKRMDRAFRGVAKAVSEALINNSVFTYLNLIKYI